MQTNDASSHMIVTTLFAFVLLSACVTVADNNYSDDFNYDYVGDVCPGTDVTIESLFQSVAKKIENHISEDDELRAAVGVVDLSKPTLAGYKSDGSTHLVQYLFGTFLRYDVILPGEGGVSAIVDACSERVTDVSFFRSPT